MNKESIFMAENFDLTTLDSSDTPEWIPALVEKIKQLEAESERLREQLAASQAECEEQARLNGMGTEREAALLARLHEVSLDWQASQAREAKLRGVILKLLDRWWPFVHTASLVSQTAKDLFHEASAAIQPPHDDTALKEYRKTFLLEAADYFAMHHDVMVGEKTLRRMAEE